MKRIEDFIKEEQLRYSNKHVKYINGVLTVKASDCEPRYAELERRNEYLNNIFDYVDITQNVLDAALDYKRDPLLEMLNTHSTDKLINKIKDIYKDKEIKVDKVNGRDVDVNSFYIMSDKKTLIDINNDDRFKNLLEFYNYFYTETVRTNNWTYRLSIYEPRYSSKVTDIYKRNNGIVYHVTTRDVYENHIKNEGLKIKTSAANQKQSYRYYPRRIYLILPNTESKTKRNDIIQNAIEKLNKKDDYVVLQINLLSLIRFSFYEDTLMNDKNENYIYTYQNIPAKFIKDITYKFNTK